MAFAKIKYHTGSLIFKVEVRDESGAIMEKWVFMEQDFQKWRRIMEGKYGLIGKVTTELDWAI